ncbi:mitochondrial ribonuclease P catalytic subunit [Pseudophryne corroboree]|uniref:mitochondrial ribonuclease P catalytic subunit n=1 Tax=Pseudophryne corroboree TaxID=495146 RepID=UPI0030815913
MLSLGLCCRTLHRQICPVSVTVSQASAIFMPLINRVQVYGCLRTISTSCSLKAGADEDGYFNKYSKQHKRATYKSSSSLFAAGAAVKRAEKSISGGKQSPERTTSMKMTLPSAPLSTNDWGILKEQYNHYVNFEELMFVQMIKNKTDINIAKSLLAFVAEKHGDISYKLLLKYLVLCVQQNQSKEIFDVYDIMKTKFATLDTGAHSLFIKGFSQTDRWRESIANFESIKKMAAPSARNYGECIKAALGHGEEKLAWTLYNEMLQNDLTPAEDVIQCIFDADRDIRDASTRSRLLGILGYLRDNQIYAGESLMKSIKSWFERIPDESWRGQLTKVTSSGNCHACKEQLESIHLKPEEYSTLKTAVIDSIIRGEDTFRKTTPEELQRFLEFVNSRPPYDIVVDGLNVAFLFRKQTLSKTLLDVVSSLAAKRKRILVLGRKHMLINTKQWLKEDIKHLQKCADCFFLDNISLDDPFLLYACLSSGSHCCFLTRDLLRDHKACLPDPEMQHLFFKWQRGHQLVIPSSAQDVRLWPVLCYDTIVQTTEDSWHIPYDQAGVKRATYEVPNTWLCLKKTR